MFKDVLNLFCCMLHCTMYFNGAVMVFACWKVPFPSVNILEAGAILTGLVFNEKICKKIYWARRWGLTPPCRARCQGPDPLKGAIEFDDRCFFCERKSAMSSLDPSIISFYSFNGRTCVPLEIKPARKITLRLDGNWQTTPPLVDFFHQVFGKP